MASSSSDSPIFNRTPIYKSILKMDPVEVLNAIASADTQVRLQDPQTRFTYLHLVVVVAEPDTENKCIPMIYQLSNAGIYIDSTDCKERTALEIAISRQLRELTVALLRVGADQTVKDFRSLIVQQDDSPVKYRLLDAYDRYSPDLWTAAVSGDVGHVHILVNSWCRVNVRRNGVALLNRLGGGRRAAEIRRLLDEIETTIEFVHATLAGDERRMLELLMNSRPCDVNIMDISHQDDASGTLRPRSLRDTAIAQGLVHVLHLIPEHMPARSEASKSEESPNRKRTPQSERRSPRVIRRPAATRSTTSGVEPSEFARVQSEYTTPDDPQPSPEIKPKRRPRRLARGPFQTNSEDNVDESAKLAPTGFDLDLEFTSLERATPYPRNQHHSRSASSSAVPKLAQTGSPQTSRSSPKAPRRSKKTAESRPLSRSEGRTRRAGDSDILWRHGSRDDGYSEPEIDYLEVTTPNATPRRSTSKRTNHRSMKKKIQSSLCVIS